MLTLQNDSLQFSFLVNYLLIYLALNKMLLQKILICHRRLWCHCVGCICRCQYGGPAHIPWVTWNHQQFLWTGSHLWKVSYFICASLLEGSLWPQEHSRSIGNWFLRESQLPTAGLSLKVQEMVFLIPSQAFSLTHHSFWSHSPNILQYLPPKSLSQNLLLQDP